MAVALPQFDRALKTWESVTNDETLATGTLYSLVPVGANEMAESTNQ